MDLALVLKQTPQIKQTLVVTFHFLLSVIV